MSAMRTAAEMCLRGSGLSDSETAVSIDAVPVAEQPGEIEGVRLAAMFE
jgi:hypothetical protein